MDSEFIKQQNLVQDVKELEKETITVGNKLHNIENEAKKEMQKKHFYEVKIAEFKRNIEYYISRSENLGVRLAAANRIHSQFETASECYEKLLSELTENYIEYNHSETKTKFENGTPELIDNLKQKLENNQLKVSENFLLIDKLLSEMRI